MKEEADKMDEVQRLFYQETAEKKRIAHGSRYTNRKGKGRIRFSFENLSAKERKELNGPTITYKMDKPMSLQDFRQMPEDIRRMYLQNLMERFHPTQSALAEMFGVSKSTLIRSMREIGVKMPPGHGKDTAEWSSWLAQDSAEEAPAEKTADERHDEPETAEPMPSQPKPDDAEPFAVHRAEELVVNATPTELAQLLSILSGPRRRVFHISFGHGIL